MNIPNYPHLYMVYFRMIYFRVNLFAHTIKDFWLPSNTKQLMESIGYFVDLLLQVGASPDHVPSAWQSRVLLPTRKNPMLQL